jgi:arylsulfatase A-like enzyme
MGNSETSRNVLIVLTDQERHFDEYPPSVERPALRRLQAMGTTFVNHYNASAVCTPSRSNIMTGQHIPHSGMFDNTNFPWQSDMSTEIPTIGDRMRDAGYYTTYKGKWHLSEDKHQEIDSGAELLGMEEYGFSDYMGLGDDIGMTRGGFRHDDATTSSAIQWLRSKGEDCRQQGQPWLMFVGLVNPHDAMFFDTDIGDDATQNQGHVMDIARAPRHERYQVEHDAPLPENLFQPFDEPGRPEAHEHYLQVHDILVGNIPRERDRFQRYQDYYFNCLMEVDSQLDRLLDELEALDMLDDTVVIYTADHGELGGAHGLHGKGPAPYEEQNNVPLVIHPPDFEGGARCEAVTSHIDLLPTLLGLSQNIDQQAVAATELPGYDLTPLLETPEQAPLDAVRDGALWAFNMFLYLDPDFVAAAVEARKAGKEPTVRPDVEKLRGAVRSVVDGQHRFTRYFAPKQHNRPETLEEILEYNDIELFDLANDPGENHNLAADPHRHRTMIESLNAKLNALIDHEIGEDIGQMLPDADRTNWHIDLFDD